jgi:hypothetical protein
MMKAVTVFAIVLLSGAVFCQQAAKVDPKFNCLSDLAALPEEATLDYSGASQFANTVDQVNHMILYYKGLSKTLRSNIDKCGLNLNQALKRCENVHGASQCAAVTTTFVNRKCPENFRIEGCCQCVINCPSNWEDNGYWCKKPASINKPLGEACPERFERVGTSLCMITNSCPKAF